MSSNINICPRRFTTFIPEPGPLQPIHNTFHNFLNHVNNARVELTQVAIARLIALFILHPIDASKARLQVTSAHSQAAVRAAARGPWFAGLPAVMIGQLPYGVLTFGLFGILQSEFSKRFPNTNNNLLTIVAACTADAAGAIWLAPAETMKLKVQTGVYPSVTHAIKAGGLYQGFLSQIVRDAPFRALHLVCYDYIRRRLSHKVGRDVKIEEGAMVGAIVGGFVGAITTPLDVVKTRLMSQRTGAGQSYRSWLSCVANTTSREGPSALFRGLVPRVVYMSATVALITVGFEASRRIAQKNGWQPQLAKANK